MSILIYTTGHVPHTFINESIFTTSAVQTVTALVLATQSWSNSCALPIMPGGDDVLMYHAILGICAGVNTKCLQLALALAMHLIDMHAPTGYLTLPCRYSQSKWTRPCSTSPAMSRQTHHTWGSIAPILLGALQNLPHIDRPVQACSDAVCQ